MGDNDFELRIPPFLGLHLVFNVDRLQLYFPPLLDTSNFPPLLDTSNIAEQIAPAKINPDCLDLVTTDWIMDT